MWQATQLELEDNGFTVIAVALDESVEAVQEWVDAASPTFPVLLDRDHIVADLYGFINVPTGVWIDEDGRLVRPAGPVFGDNSFTEFHGIDSTVHHGELRSWVLDGELPAPAVVREGIMAPTREEQEGRAEHRLAVHLLRAGRKESAARHFDRAAVLAPDDWTIRRGSLPLRGEDPFGMAFFELYEDKQQRGGRRY